MIRRVRSLLALVVLAGLGFADAGAATHRITYLTATTAYIDAGRDDGVVVEGIIKVVREGTVIATLLVTDVSSHRAACVIDASAPPLVVGDTITFTPVKVPATVDSTRTQSGRTRTTAALPAMEPAQPRAVSWARRNGLRGRAGVRYLGVIDQSGFGGNIAQPSADVRIDGTRVGKSPFDLQIDVRARHTFQTVADGRQFDDGQARVYRLNTMLRSPKDHLRVTLGRQFSSSLTSVSTFDGVQVEYDVSRWGTGTFAGTQPGPVDYGFSTDIKEYGVFTRLRSQPQARTRWEAVVAAIGSYQLEKINREYISLVGRVNSARLSLMAQQEIDVFRGWRHEQENAAAALTSTFATARYRVTPKFDLDAGYDNRRDPRLYRDYVSPETVFDDSYRQGVWGGAGLRLTPQFRLGTNARLSNGGGAGDATSYTMTASADRISPWRLGFRLRSTRYANNSSDGWMHTLAGNVPVGPRWLFELYGGVRKDVGKTPLTPDVSTSWFGLDADLGLGQNWYLNMSGERNGQGDNAYDQVYTSVSWRF
jgi:hypothetical protein